MISILSIFDQKHLKFKYAHLESVNFTILEEDTELKQKKLKDFEEYQKFLKKNEIILDHNKREKLILKRLQSICKTRSCKNQ